MHRAPAPLPALESDWFDLESHYISVHKMSPKDAKIKLSQDIAEWRNSRDKGVIWDTLTPEQQAELLVETYGDVIDHCEF